MKGEFYKMDFRAWNIGTVDLPLEQEAAYLRLCHAMYDVGGPVPNSTRMLMGLFRCGNTKAAALLNALIAAGKIAITSDNRLINHRVVEELANREKVSSARRVAGERGGSATRATAERLPSDHRPNHERLPSDGEARNAKLLKNKERRQAIASTPQSRGEEIREEKKDLLSEAMPSDDQNAPKDEKPVKKRKRIDYPGSFEELWRAFPTDENMSKQEAYKAWAQLEDDDKSSLMRSVGPFKAWVAKQRDYRTVHLERYIKWRRFDGFAQKAAQGSAASSNGSSIPDDSWRRHVKIWLDESHRWMLGRHSPPPDDPRTIVPRHILSEFNIHPAHARAA